MGMPCEVNSILKLTPSQGYPDKLTIGERFQVEKSGYRILPIDVPIMLVDADWWARADVVIETLTWSGGVTRLEFAIARIYETPVLCH
jgi:hypothetical protein